MKETSYRVQQQRETFEAYKGNNLIAMGCITQGDALQAIWVLEGKNPDEKYHIVNGVVICSK